MTTLSRVILLYGILMLKVIHVKSGTAKPQNVVETKTFEGNGYVGVASVAEITSRNGRVSSTGQIKFFPATDTKTKDNKQGAIKQWKFSKKSGDGFAMGAVQVYPGSVVSSVASVGTSNSNLGSDPKINWPMLHNNFPPPAISPRTNLSPYHHNNMFKNIDPMIPDLNNIWSYHNYHPFLPLWR